LHGPFSKRNNIQQEILIINKKQPKNSPIYIIYKQYKNSNIIVSAFEKKKVYNSFCMGEKESIPDKRKNKQKGGNEMKKSEGKSC